MTPMKNERYKSIMSEMIMKTMLDRRNIVGKYETYAYLICQDSLWEDMDADRRDVRVKVTIVTMRQDGENGDL